VNFASKAEKRNSSKKLSTVRDRLPLLGSALHLLFSLANRIPTSSAPSTDSSQYFKVGLVSGLGAMSKHYVCLCVIRIQ